MLRHGTQHDTGLGGCRTCEDPTYAFTYIIEVLESCPFERVAFNPCQPPFIQVRSPSQDVAFLVDVGSSRRNLASRLDKEGMQAIKTHAAQTLHRIKIGRFGQAEADRWLHACTRIDPGPAQPNQAPTHLRLQHPQQQLVQEQQQFLQLQQQLVQQQQQLMQQQQQLCQQQRQQQLLLSQQQQQLPPQVPPVAAAAAGVVLPVGQYISGEQPFEVLHSPALACSVVFYLHCAGHAIDWHPTAAFLQAHPFLQNSLIVAPRHNSG